MPSSISYVTFLPDSRIIEVGVGGNSPATKKIKIGIYCATAKLMAALKIPAPHPAWGTCWGLAVLSVLRTTTASIHILFENF